MQALAGMSLIGVTRQSATATAPRRTGRLSLRDALAIAGAEPTRSRSRAPIPTVLPKTSTRLPAAARSDAAQRTVSAVQITEAQAREHLPPGRYQYRDHRGKTVTREVGVYACALGRKVRELEAASNGRRREKAAQQRWLRQGRC